MLTTKVDPVMLSAAKHLAAHRARPFAEFTLSEAKGRVTNFTDVGSYNSYLERYFNKRVVTNLKRCSSFIKHW